MMVFSSSRRSGTKSPPKRGLSSNGGIFRHLKLQKGSKPFSGWKIYLDLKNLNALSKLEASVKSLGGVVSPFIGEDINLVVTDRAEWGGNVNSGASGSPLGTPRPSPSPSPSPLPQLFSPLASPAGNSRGSNVSPIDSPGEAVCGGRRHPKSRGEAMVERVRLQPQLRTRDPLLDAQSWDITICSVEKILRLIQKVTQSDQRTVAGSQTSSAKQKSADNNKYRFRSGRFFLKVESTDRKFRPSYKDLPCWPTINLDSEPGTSPFKVSPSPIRSANAEPNISVKVNEATPSASKQSCVALRTPQTPSTRRSPKKSLSTLKESSALNNERNNTGSVFSRKIHRVEQRVNLVPPRPPSKRHPERSQFLPRSKDQQANPGPELQPGYCEICKVDYSDLRSHLDTESHRSFSMNEDNYASLDRLIELTHIHVDAFRSSLCCDQSRSSELEEQGLSSVTTQLSSTLAGAQKNMRQPVDDRQVASKMVGRKDALEVQCNGLSNHMQTRFTCTKGDRENLGSIFLDDRITAAQLRKRRAISVSCKDLLELGPSGERTHFLRSARAARSELSQLSPALSDNSHPLLNGNTQQPLLSPTLSERSHSLRTRSQIWLPSNLIGEESLLVTASNQLDKAKCDKLSEKVDKNDKSDRNDKIEKSKVTEDLDEPHMRKDADKEQREMSERCTKSPRNHCRNRSIRRKRLSAEEKLIEDNRGYYKVEVLNSKLRSTGYFASHEPNHANDTPNGRITPVGRPGSQGDIKEPVVVRFKKVRRSELSVLSDEAENFMFGEQTRSETNSDDSSEYETDGENEEETEDDHDHCEEGCHHHHVDDGQDHNSNEEHSTDSRNVRSHQRSARRSSNGNSSCRETLRRLKIKVGGCGSSSRCSSIGVSIGNSGTIESNVHRKHRKRRTQAEAFITDNMDYYKFETPETRLRIHGSPNSPTDEPHDDAQEKVPNAITDGSECAEVEKAIDGSPCPIDKLHFSFESVPSSEIWYQTFQRQDRGEEICFPLVGEPSPVVLPYQIPKVDVPNGQRPSSRRRTKNSVRLPRKSPRCHASTLAILSSLVRRRNSREPEKVASLEESPIVQPNTEPDLMNPPCKKVSANVVVPEERHAKDECLQDGADIQEIARNIDSILGIPSWNELDKDSETSEVKSPGKGRGRKKQGPKSASVACEAAGSSGVSSSDKDKDPSLKYLVDPAIFEELSCTCDVVSNPYGGPTMDIVTLLNTYSDCCCIGDDTSVEHGIDASCNSSECGASSTCEMRMRKKRKRRNMTGWDKPKRRGVLRRDISSVLPLEETEDSKGDAQKCSVEPIGVIENFEEGESGVSKIPHSFPHLTFTNCGRRRKLRSTLVDCSSRKGSNSSNQNRVQIMKTDRETEVSGTVKKGKLKKVRRMGWPKVR